DRASTAGSFPPPPSRSISRSGRPTPSVSSTSRAARRSASHRRPRAAGSAALATPAPAAGDWKLTDLGWVFTLAIVFLGLSAAVFGRWLEEAGPRKSGLGAASSWGRGFLVGGAG